MKQKLLTTLEMVENYTTGVAELMPEEGYEFKPADALWNFRELIHHLAYGIHWWENNFIRQKKVSWEPPAVPATKQETLHYLGQAFASLKRTVGAAEATEEVIYGFFSTVDHITHHRGQATIYLRCQGIIPPEYVF
ncbi:MAG TPA: DinB family protein [Puia sp.]|nr:DinB family protein [Puia sp.]